MQYLLTEEEYKALCEAKKTASKVNIAELQKFCTRVANELPVDWGWSKDEPEKPWGCILTAKGEWYCDQCPAQKVCPHPNKHWSK